MVQLPEGFNPTGRHPLSAAAPDYTQDQLEELVESIRTQGRVVNDRIWILDGLVLDGWHRYIAYGVARMTMPKLPPLEFVAYEGDDPGAFVYDNNAVRRQMTEVQKALFRERIMTITGTPAARFQETDPHLTRELNEDPDGQSADAPQDDPEAQPDGQPADTGSVYTREEVAEAAGVNVANVDRARAIESAGLGDAVMSGQMSQREALDSAQQHRQGDEGGQSRQRRSREDGDRQPTRIERFQAQVDSLTIERDQLLDELDEARARIRFLEGEQRPDDAREIEFNRLRQQLKVVESSRDEFMQRHSEEKSRANGLQRVVRQLEDQLKAVGAAVDRSQAGSEPGTTDQEEGR